VQQNAIILRLLPLSHPIPGHIKASNINAFPLKMTKRVWEMQLSARAIAGTTNLAFTSLSGTSNVVPSITTIRNPCRKARLSQLSPLDALADEIADSFLALPIFVGLE